jgi:hypothetical protein
MGVRSLGTVATTVGILFVASAQGVVPLQGRDINGYPVDAYSPNAVMEYDPNLNITWLRDWRASQPMDWNTARTWASTLRVGAFGDWVLPTMNTSDTHCSRSSDPGGGFQILHFGYNCIGSPIGYLQYLELGNASPGAVPNAGPFLNMQADFYWYGTELEPNPTGAWYFDVFHGWQGAAERYSTLYAVAVRPGDVLAPVPEAKILALMLTGLGLLVMARCRRA